MSETKATNYKVVIVGKSAVGKSSLMFRFTDDRFNENYLTTIGVDFKFRSFKLKEQSYKLQIWDTAGQEKYQTITKTFYKGAHAVIVVFDLTNKKSFDDLKEQWFPEIENNCDEDVVIAIVGNKNDLETEREVDRELATKFANSKDCVYVETSAKTGQNVETLFFEMTEKVSEKEKLKEEENTNRIENLETRNEGNNAPGCC